MAEQGVWADPIFLKCLRAKHGLTQEQAAARATAGRNGQWSRWERRKERMRGSSARKIAAAFDEPIEKIAPELAESAHSLLDQATRFTGHIAHHGEAAGGVDTHIIAEESTQYIEQLEQPLASVVISGNSMAPIVRDGQRVVFDPDASVTSGDLALIHLTDGRLLCKRYYEDRRLKIATLVSQQNDHPVEPVSVRLDEIVEIYKVVGVFFN